METKAQRTDHINSIVAHLFRNEYGKVVSYLAGKFGAQHFEMAEDSTQEAIYMAMKTWPFREIPNNPSGWIFRTASNKMIDKLRRLNKVELSQELNDHFEDPIIAQNFENLNNELKDEQLQMLFACCHPTLSAEYQIILSLKILCGFGIREIATSLVKNEATVAKAYTRARQKFIKEEIKLEVPSTNEIEKRLKVVLKIIYLLFNEGYKTSTGNELYKSDLCLEALRLNKLLHENKNTNTPEAQALTALMMLHMARFESRVGIEGELVTLEKQDRSLWNQEMIQIGLAYLNNSIKEGHYSEYHIQAAIAATHCQAMSFEETNWPEILTLYDAMIKLNPSPVIKLNRLIPLSKVKGIEVAIERLQEIEASGFFSNYYLFYVVKGQFEQEKGNRSLARTSFSRALLLANNIKEKQFLEFKISQLS